MNRRENQDKINPLLVIRELLRSRIITRVYLIRIYIQMIRIADNLMIRIADNLMIRIVYRIP